MQRRIIALGPRFGLVLVAQDRLFRLPEANLTTMIAADATMDYGESHLMEPKPQN